MLCHWAHQQMYTHSQKKRFKPPETVPHPLTHTHTHRHRNLCVVAERGVCVYVCVCVCVCVCVWWGQQWVGRAVLSGSREGGPDKGAWWGAWVCGFSTW